MMLRHSESGFDPASAPGTQTMTRQTLTTKTFSTVESTETTSRKRRPRPANDKHAIQGMCRNVGPNLHKYSEQLRVLAVGRLEVGRLEVGRLLDRGDETLWWNSSSLKGGGEGQQRPASSGRYLTDGVR
jgi:hypothetical protein